MSTVDHERHSEDLGAYLLGALPELEAQMVERHIVGCAECKAELERLQPAADVLPHAVDAYEPPPSLKRSLMEEVERDVRARGGTDAAPRPWREWLLGGRLIARPRLAAAGAIAVLVLGLAVGYGADRLTRGGGGGTRTLAAHIDRRALPGGSAELAVPRHGAATLRVRGLQVLRGGRVYEVWLERAGAVSPAGALFAVAADGSGTAAIPAGLHGVARVLVTRERAGGAPQPTEPPIISFRT